MPVWILIVVIAQFLYAAVSLIDKYILTSKKVEKPFALAFFVSLLTVFSFGIYLLEFLPINFGEFDPPSVFRLIQPDMAMIAMALVAGYTFFYGLVSLYSALRESDASDVIPVIGAISAVVAFLINYGVLGQSLPQNFLVGFLLLVIGTVLISSFRLSKDVISVCISAGILFAMNATMMKSMFLTSSFDDAFFWSRIGTLAVIMSLMLVPRYRGKILFNAKRTTKSGSAWVIGKTILAGIAGLLVLKAIELGDVSLVQALGGLQFAFLAVMSFILGPITPKTCGENNGVRDIIQKALAITAIFVGFFYLFF